MQEFQNTTRISNVLSSLAQMERELIVERTRAGLSAARKRGRVGGRKRLMTPNKDKSANKLVNILAQRARLWVTPGRGKSALPPEGARKVVPMFFYLSNRSFCSWRFSFRSWCFTYFLIISESKPTVSTQ